MAKFKFGRFNFSPGETNIQANAYPIRTNVKALLFTMDVSSYM